MATIANLTVRLSAQIAEFQSEFREAQKSAEKFADNFEGIATRAAAVGAFLGNIAADIAGSLARAFGQGIKDAIRLSSEFSNAFIGLSSVARAFGTDADAAKSAAQRLSADGLLPLKDSATGLKNLLAAGFNLDQSVKLMDAFKDSAAFGRQSALSFGDAVRSATEGVKNGNSILVDNAGVTKNLSQILKEAGFSAQDLSRASSDAGVRLALFNGILRETAAQTGDAQKLTQTYAGQVARLQASYDNFLATLGTAITQNATVAKVLGAVADAVVGLNTKLVSNRNAFNLVSEGVILFARSIRGVIVSVDLVIRAVNAMDSALKNVVNAFANANLAIVTMLVDVAKLAAQLPGGTTALGVFAKEIGGLLIAQDAFGRIARSSADDIKNNADRVQKWGGILGDAKASMSQLITVLEQTRGKTVELGESATVTGAALSTGLSGGSKKAQEELKKLKTLLEETTPGLREGISGTVGVNIGKPDLDSVLIPDIILKTRLALREGIASMPGIRIPIAPPTPSEVSQVFTALVDQTKDVASDIAHQLSDNLVKLLPAPLRAGFKNIFSGAIDAVRADGIRGLVEFGKATAKDFVFGFAGELVNLLPKGLRDVFGQALGALEAGGLRGLGQFAKNFAKEFTKDFATGFIGEMLSFIPVVGSSLKQLAAPLVDFLGGLFGNKGRDLVKDFAASMGGFDELQRRLGEMGDEGARLWAKLTQGVGRNNPEQARAVIAEVQAALAAFGTEAERTERKLTDFSTAIAGVNTKAELFAAPFRKFLGDKTIDDVSAKLAEMGQRGQAEFERIGTFAAAAFAGIVRESGDAIGAINQLTPTFQVLKEGIEKFGLSSTGTIDALLSMFSLVTDAVTGPIFQAIQATGQIFTGLQQGGILTAELFQTVATDIGASFRELEAKGGDVAKAMALSQPILQKLWEAQQIYGEITDETTAKLLRQAEEQGLVGAHMKDVNQKILDVLIAIADVFGAKIPEGMRATARAATDTARGITRDFIDAGLNAGRGLEEGLGRIKIPKLTIPIDFEFGDFTPPPGTVRPLAEGGIVRRPTLALIGEAGPEAVIPLSNLSAASGGGTVILQLDGRQIARVVVPHFPGVVREYVPA